MAKNKQTPPRDEGARNPKINISFDEHQKKVHEDFHTFDVNIVEGKYGSGKTLVAVGMAILGFRKKQFGSIIISRKAGKDNLGFTPGEIDDKMKKWVAPIIHNFNMCQSSSTTEKMKEKNNIQISPLDHMRGITWVNSCVIIDEYQDLTTDEFKLVLSRLGKGSKIIFCGDSEQASSKSSCTMYLDKVKKSGFIGYNVLQANHRHPILDKLLPLIPKV